MKKMVFFGFVFLLMIQITLAADLIVNKTDMGSVLVSEYDEPANFKFVINNPDAEQYAEFHSFVGVSFLPKGKFNLTNGRNEIEVKAFPAENYRNSGGLFNFEYIIIPQNSPVYKDVITVKIVKLKEILEFKPQQIQVGDSTVKILLKNKENVSIDNLKLKFTSQFFSQEKVVAIGPQETKEIVLDLDKDRINGLLTGPYEYSIEASTFKSDLLFKGKVDYVPKEESNLQRETSGFIIRKVTFTKTNTGNTPINAEIDFQKDVLSRLFTTSSVEPVSIERKALFAEYRYEKMLKPGESLQVVTTTNYTLPFILALLVIVVALLVKIYSRTNITLDKRVNFVKTKGGEFALKIRVHVKAKKYVENVEVIDRLPGLTQLYEKFGIRPDRIDAASRRLIWKIERLNAGEERIFSYIVFSKVNVVGRFELPSATATYQRDGVTEQVFSNRTFFVSEQTKIS